MKTSAVGSHGVATENDVTFDKETNSFIRRRSFRLLATILQPQRARVVWLLLVIVGTQAARAGGPLLIAIGINRSLPRVQEGDFGLAIWYGVALLALGLAGGLLSWWSIKLTSAVCQAALLLLRQRVFLHVQQLSLEFHENYTSGRSIARQTSDLDDVREFLDSGINQFISAFVYMAVVIVLMATLDPLSSLIFLIALIPVFFVTRWFHRQSQIQYRSSRVASANLIVQFVETMTGIRAIQAFRHERKATDEHRIVSEDYRDADVRAFSLNGVYDPTLVLIGNLTVAAILAIDGYRMLTGDIALGVLVAAVLYAKRFFQPLEQMARFYNSLQSAIASLEKVSGLLEEEVGPVQRDNPRSIDSARGELTLDSVGFSYRGGKSVVADLDLVIPAGQTIALVGSTGAGKSTIAKLVARFYDPTRGSVLLDGVDLRDIHLADLRRHILVVTQESYLFGDSIAANIAIGKPGAERDEIVAAAKTVGAHEFICALSDGYDTKLNQRGARLSAGQRQLVSFARAFLADPTVLILDEATSSLDSTAETLIQSALSTLLKDRTAIIIAHRLSTVDIADRVVVLRNGRVVDDGTPREFRISSKLSAGN